MGNGLRIRLLSGMYTVKTSFCWLWGGLYLPKRTPRLNRAQIHNQSLAATVCRSLSHTMHVRVKPEIESSAFYSQCSCSLSRTLQSSSWNHISLNGLRLAPSNWSFAPMSSFASLPTNQSSFIMRKQGVGFWQSGQCCLDHSNCKFGLSICIKMDWSGTRGGSLYKQSSLLSLGSTVLFSTGGYISLVCKLFT